MNNEQGANTTFVGRHLFSDAGDEIGKVEDVIANPRIVQPEWLVVKTGGRLRAKNHLVPVAAVTERGESLVVPFDRETVASSPVSDANVAPPRAVAEETYRHYHLEAPMN